MGTRIPSVRDATRTDKDRGGGAYTVNRDTPFRPGQTSFSWLQEVFPMGTKRELRSDGFVFSRLTVAACALPAGNQVHGPDSRLSAAISGFRPQNTLKPLRGAQKKTRLLSVSSVCRRRRLSVCSGVSPFSARLINTVVALRCSSRSFLLAVYTPSCRNGGAVSLRRTAYVAGRGLDVLTDSIGKKKNSKFPPCGGSGDVL